MTLIVEDGTGLAGAESYVSVAEATAYHANRGNSVWAGLATDTIREQLLRKATDYLSLAYYGRWLGEKNTTTQALDYPREGQNFVPTAIKNACCELALRAIDTDLMPDETQKVIREKVDVIEVEYDRFSSVQTRYAQVDSMLSALLIPSSRFTAKVVRA